MKRTPLFWLPLLLLAGCSAPSPSQNAASSSAPQEAAPAQAAASAAAPADQEVHSAPSASLLQARRGFRTVLRPRTGRRRPVEKAPASLFRTLKYPAQAGALAAYLSPDPGDGKKHPAILWINGGDCNSIRDVWTPAPRRNDQTAAAYRKAGIVMMFPSLRGGNDNPGRKEGFLGEVDDVLAASKYLEKQPYVDPRRIYLGGHSTGGTLALLVAECSHRFRAVFSFAPVANVSSYEYRPALVPFDITSRREVELRSPGLWLACVRSPTWVLEGDTTDSNIGPLRQMAQASTNPRLRFIEIRGASHRSGLASTNALIARKIVGDTGGACSIALSAGEVSRSFAG